MADMTRFNYYMTWTIKKTLPDNGPKLVGLLTKLPGTNVRSTLTTVLLYISFLIDSLHVQYIATSNSGPSCVGHRRRLRAGREQDREGGMEIGGSHHRQVLMMETHQTSQI